MEQNKATLQAALRALRVGKEVVTSVQALTPHIKASGDLETIKNGAEDYYREITGVVGGVINYQIDEDSSIDPLQMEEQIRSIVEAPESDNPLQIQKYSVTKETAALLSCIEELNTLYGHIYEALSLIYDPVMQVDGGVVGKELFEALRVVDSELYSFLSQSIRESLCITSGVREI